MIGSNCPKLRVEPSLDKNSTAGRKNIKWRQESISASTGKRHRISTRLSEAHKARCNYIWRGFGKAPMIRQRLIAGPKCAIQQTRREASFAEHGASKGSKWKKVNDRVPRPQSCLTPAQQGAHSAAVPRRSARPRVQLQLKLITLLLLLTPHVFLPHLRIQVHRIHTVALCPETIPPIRLLTQTRKYA